MWLTDTVKKEKALKVIKLDLVIYMSQKDNYNESKKFKTNLYMKLKFIALSSLLPWHSLCNLKHCMIGKNKAEKKREEFSFLTKPVNLHVTDKTNKQTKNQIFHYCSNAQFPRYQKHKCVKNATQKVLSPITFIFFSCNIVSPSKEKSECTELLG